MNCSRRTFLQASLGTGLVAGANGQGAEAERPRRGDPSAPEPPGLDLLDRIAAEPVLHVESLKTPIRIASMELLLHPDRGGTYLVRVRSVDGAVGLAVPNSAPLRDAYPIFLNRVAPFFIGKDARDLERLLWELYRFQSNYKWQGLAFWVCVAAAEFAILDLLGQRTGQSVGDLLGGVKRREVAVYRASGNRDNSPAAEIEHLQRLVEGIGAKAIKFRVGGRMSLNRDSRPGRSEALIPLVREAFGPDMTLYVDANSSYDAPQAIRIGRLLEEYDYAFFEEPCRFDHLEETKQVADALTIPVAGGEQEFSQWRFGWMIHQRGVDIVQPDLHYYGGFIRSMRVARMADAAGIPCVPHMSGSGLGYLDAAHFVSCMPNPGPYHEFKGESGLPVSSDTSSLKCEDGVVRVPSGPGFGITLDPGFVRQAEVVKRG